MHNINHFLKYIRFFYIKLSEMIIKPVGINLSDRYTEIQNLSLSFILG